MLWSSWFVVKPTLAMLPLALGAGRLVFDNTPRLACPTGNTSNVAPFERTASLGRPGTLHCERQGGANSHPEAQPLGGT